MIVIRDKLSTAEVLIKALNLYKLGPDVGTTHQAQIVSMFVEVESKTGSQLSGSSKFFTAFSLANYSKIDLEW